MVAGKLEEPPQIAESEEIDVPAYSVNILPKIAGVGWFVFSTQHLQLLQYTQGEHPNWLQFLDAEAEVDGFGVAGGDEIGAEVFDHFLSFLQDGWHILCEGLTLFDEVGLIWDGVHFGSVLLLGGIEGEGAEIFEEGGAVAEG